MSETPASRFIMILIAGILLCRILHSNAAAGGYVDDEVVERYEALERILSTEQWPEVSVLCEDKYCDALHTRWHGVVPVTWLVVTNTDEAVMNALTHTNTVNSKHVVLAAGDDIIIRIINQVQTADSKLNQDSVLLHRVEWIVLRWMDTQRHLADIVGNIVNIVLLTTEDHGGTYTCEFTPSGRAFSFVEPNAEFYPNKKYGLNGKHVLVGTNYWGLFMYSDGSEEDDFNGACVDVMTSLSARLNFTFSFVLPPDMGWGAVDENNTWNGLGGQLQRKEVNLVCAAYSLTYQRTEVADITTVPFFIEDSIILYRRPNPNEEAITLFIRPLRVEVWGVMLSSIVVAGITLRLLAGLSIDSTDFNSYYMSAWYAVQIAFYQGTPHTPKSSAPRLAFACFWISTFILVATYGGNLVAALSVNKFTPPFTNLEEMANQNQYKFGTISSSFWESKFKYGTNPTDSLIWQRIQEWEAAGEHVMHPGVAGQKELVDAGNYAAITDISTARQLMLENCDLVLAPYRFLANNYPVYLQKHSAYTDDVSNVLYDLIDTGTMQQFLKRHQEGAPPCEEAAANKVLSMMHLQGVFYILASGTGLAFVVLITEIVVGAVKGVGGEIKPQGG